MSEAHPDLQAAFDALDDISDLSHVAWRDAVEEFSEEYGYMLPLGPHFSAAFLDSSPRLLVCFDSFESATERAAKGYPMGMGLAATHGWSSLSLLSHSTDLRDGWFRNGAIYRYFDRLVDDGFFEDFDQVVFYGAGAHGYAAAAYSVAAPGSTVIAVAPQATLNGRLASWDNRFPDTRRMDFTSRYGFAPDMVDAAQQAVILYDPAIDADAIHAAMFYQPHVLRRPCRLFGTDPEFEMMEMGALEQILCAAMEGALTAHSLTRALRKRRDNMGYLRRLLSALPPEKHPLRTALLCRHAAGTGRAGPRFQRAMESALEQLEAQMDAQPASTAQ